MFRLSSQHSEPMFETEEFFIRFHRSIDKSIQHMAESISDRSQAVNVEYEGITGKILLISCQYIYFEISLTIKLP